MYLIMTSLVEAGVGVLLIAISIDYLASFECTNVVYIESVAMTRCHVLERPLIPGLAGWTLMPTIYTILMEDTGR